MQENPERVKLKWGGIQFTAVLEKAGLDHPELTFSLDFLLRALESHQQDFSSGVAIIRFEV